MKLSLIGQLVASWLFGVVAWAFVAKLAHHQSICVYGFAIMSIGMQSFLAALAIAAYYEKGGKNNPDLIKSIKTLTRLNPLALVVLIVSVISIVFHELIEVKEDDVA